MGKRKTPRSFIPGFTSLSDSIFVQDANYVAHQPYPWRPTPSLQHQEHQQQRQPQYHHQHQQHQQPDVGSQGRPHLASEAPAPVLTFTASSNPLPLPASSEATTYNAPDLIILTAWTGAEARHVAKYTLSYAQLYPGTPQLLITTSIADLTMTSMEHKLERLGAAVNYLTTSRPRQILLHAFSEGGAHKAVCLARAYRLSTGARLAVRAFVFDSAPGTPRYRSNVAAFRRALPRNKALRALGVPFGASVLAVHWVVFCVFVGYEQNLITQTRRALNDEDLWEDVRGAPRTYLFSEGDDLIDWRDVERHGEETAEGLGVRSLLVRFKESGHCGHARGNEGLYWGAVRRTWESREGAAGPGPRESVGRGSTGARDLVLTCVCCGEKLGA